jgi:hypothetical protein
MRIMMNAALVAFSLACAGEAAAERVCRCVDGELGLFALAPQSRRRSARRASAPPRHSSLPRVWPRARRPPARRSAAWPRC